MPYKCKLIDKKWRIIKPDTGRVAKNKEGTALDGDGHTSESACMKQVRALYWSESKNIENYHDIFLYGEIGWDINAAMIQAAMQGLAKDQTLRLRINSRGGSFIEAIAIFNILRENDNILTYIEGAALSAAAVIALGGSKVLMAQNGLMMIHGPVMDSSGRTLEQLKVQTEALEKATIALKDTIKAKCGKSDEEIDNLLSKDSWFTSYEAYNYGLIDEIVDISNVTVALDEIPEVPDVILNHVKNKGNNVMPIKDVLKKLNLPCEDNTTEDQMISIIENHIKTITDAKIVVPPPIPASSAIINIVKKSRETEINNLVSEGKISGAVATDLKATYASEEALKKVIDAKGNITDNFDSIITTLAKNERIINFGGRTGVQRLEGEHQKKNALMKDMESRK